jgi:hypothetical protein
MSSKKKHIVAVIFEHINRLIDENNDLKHQNKLLEKRLKILEINTGKLISESRRIDSKHKYLRERVGIIGDSISIIERKINR